MPKFLKEDPPTKDPDKFLQVEHLQTDLKKRSIRGGAVVVLTEAFKFCLQMGSIVVLARLLSPEDYGLVGMVNVVMVFLGLFKDFGLSAATIQKTDINHKQVSTLFWINVAMGCILALIVAALAPVVALFYKEPRLTWITVALASGFIFSGLTAQCEALLWRQMRFSSLAQIQIISLTAGLVTAIISALYGAGYWALVFMQLITIFVNAIGVWVISDWRPGLPIRNSGVRSMLAFGGNLTGFYFVEYFSRNLDNILIGYFWGPQQLGLYSKAYQLLYLPIRQITTPVGHVALPTLSRLQNEPEKYNAYLYKTLLAMAALGMPIVAFTFAAADKIVLAFLGPQWLDSVPIFRLLAPAALVGILWTGWIYQSLGRTARMFRWGAIAAIVDVSAFLIGIHWNAIGVAAAFSLSQVILLVPAFAYCIRGTSLKLTELAITLSRPVLISTVAAVAIIGIDRLLPKSMNIGLSLFISSILYCILYIAMWMFTPAGRNTLVEMLSAIKELKFPSQ
ncbi:lipopolysaccharide biosynthesis protein [Scytonema millei]|uniref:Lipopolysaccharide biosynthesis protein n=1 Tax=Scytonema millei VB511283 TaxID=1245923 RepID=A0A9X5E246_9CYAN|nr:lipopolysaccharide biosynthesis protein [Scytonema millei]NHC33846.1 lipopolysaccharide biosynthesis protein [Scytonema millei VB511283]